MQQLWQRFRGLGDSLEKVGKGLGAVEIRPFLQGLVEMGDGGFGVQIASWSGDAVDDVDVDVGESIGERLKPERVLRSVMRRFPLHLGESSNVCFYLNDHSSCIHVHFNSSM